MKGESEVETEMKRKKHNIGRGSKAGITVNSEGETVTGATVRNVIDGDDDDDDDDDGDGGVGDDDDDDDDDDDNIMF